MGLALCWLGWVGVGLLVGLFVCLLRMVLLWLQLEPCPELQGMFFLGESKDFYAVKCKCEGAVQGRLRAL